MTADQQPTDEAEWWDDPALPWRQKPTRADYACLSAMGVVAVYALIMLPLRPVMLGLAPHLLGSLGYRTGVVMTGALAATGDQWWPLVLVVGSLMTIKFHWVYWWAGRLWGRSIMDVWANGKSERTKRRWNKVWDLADRYSVPAIVLTFLPIPIPASIVYAALGAAGTRLRTFLITCIASSLATSAGYMTLGYAIGEPAVELIDQYGWFLWYISLAIIVVMIATALWKNRQDEASAGEEGTHS